MAENKFNLSVVINGFEAIDHDKNLGATLKFNTPKEAVEAVMSLLGQITDNPDMCAELDDYFKSKFVEIFKKEE